MGRGLFIVLEGANRTHKHTFAQILRNNIQQKTGQKVHVLKIDSRGSAQCPIIPNFLQGEAHYKDHIIHHIFSADRWRLSHHLRHLINRGNTVILQRYVASGHAYSMAHGNLDLEWCKQFDSGLLKPDITIYLERDPSSPHEIIFEDPDIYENSEMQTKLVEKFNQLKEPDWLVIDIANGNPRQALIQVLPLILVKLNQSLKGELEINYYD